MQKLLASIFLLLASFFLVENHFYDAAKLFGWAGIISGVIIILIPAFKAVFGAGANPSGKAMNCSPGKTDTDSQK